MRIETYNPSHLFRALGDETRLRIVRLLAGGSLCVCQIVDALQAPQYRISRHLGILKAAGIVADRREGTWIHYSLRPKLPPLAQQLVRAVASCCADGIFAEDDARLAKSKPRAPKQCGVRRKGAQRRGKPGA